jgi:hypothetical protein
MRRGRGGTRGRGRSEDWSRGWNEGWDSGQGSVWCRRWSRGRRDAMTGACSGAKGSPGYPVDGSEEKVTVR